ncbi:hypothetical protein L9F63_000517 [Diploptera punctata]|uniref:Ionotropic glutamate receptor C-terminal domain-containing protein n=1 Tax=Diploptera punctata TaxID=6984 RepID=A0AAD8ALE1_DIPPU|nr:hypothetical protein L9F63_000517 [Diploptera punctata]
MKAIYMFYLSLCVKFYLVGCDLDVLPEVHRQAVHCIKQVMAQYFEEDAVLVISDPRNTHINVTGRKLETSYDVLISDVIIRELTNGSSRPAVVWYQRDYEDAVDMYTRFSHEKLLNFVFILSDYGVDTQENVLELAELMNLYLFERLFGYWPKVLIAFPEMSKVVREYMNGFLQNLLTIMSMYNVALIFPRTEYVGSDDRFRMVSEIYSWFPFEHGQCGECWHLEFIDRWNTKGNGQFEHNTDLFPQKLPKQFDGCSIKYRLFLGSTASWRFELFLLHTLFRLMNITHFVRIRGSGDYDLSFWRNFNDEDDNLKDENIVPLRKSFPHMFSTLRWYVPCPEKTVRHGNFYKVFGPGVWLLFFISCVLMAMVADLLHRSTKCEYLDSLTYSLYCVWAVVTSVSVPQMPTTTKLRIVFFVWVCYCLAISNIFQSFFTSFIIEPGTEEQISTIEEFINQDLSLFGNSEGFFVFFQLELKEEVNDEFLNKLEAFRYPIKEFFTHKRSGVIATDVDMKLHIPGYVSWIEPCFFYFSDHLSEYLLIFHPFSPYYEAFNSRVLEFHEGGIFTKLIDDYISSHSRTLLNVTNIENKFRRESAKDYFVFNMKHMKVVFIIYLCGNILSVVIFVAEVVLGKK